MSAETQSAETVEYSIPNRTFLPLHPKVTEHHERESGKNVTARNRKRSCKMLSPGQEADRACMGSQLLQWLGPGLHNTELINSKSQICLDPSEPTSDLGVSRLTDQSTNISLSLVHCYFIFLFLTLVKFYYISLQLRFSKGTSILPLPLVSV